jgi:alpha-tubulin suppressor-like RCC1 family protein
MTIVTVAPAMANVMVGQQIQLGATTTDAMGNVLTGRLVTWASSNTAVATVTSTGLVMALALGNATITATSEGQSGTAALTTTTGLMFAMVSAGSRHTCGLTPSGVAYCWGDNSSGQLGNGTTTNSATPVPVSGALIFVSVSNGGNHTCGATPGGPAGGAAYCWGDNSSGQLGDGTMTNTATPVPVAGGRSFLTVSAGGRHTCGVSGPVACWGDNSSGQLGNGTLTNSSVPVFALLPNGLQPVETVSAGNNHTCAIERRGGFAGILFVFCWGDNSSGQLGNGTMTNSATPVSVSTSQAGLLSAGTLYSCALGFPSAASCWGNNGAGQLGNGTTVNSATPVPVSGALIFPSVSTGALHACGPVNSSVNGTAFSYAYCWGDNSSGQLGNGTTTNSAMPIVVAGGLNFAVVSAGGRHTCGVIGIASNLRSPTAAGAVYCWGDNTFGQLGNGWTTSTPVPVNVAGQS